MSARYVAGSADAQVGGDWYDVIALATATPGSRSATSSATASTPRRAWPGSIFDIVTALSALELALAEAGAEIERGAAAGRALETYAAGALV